jgi:hypothetical protein
MTMKGKQLVSIIRSIKDGDSDAIEAAAAMVDDMLNTATQQTPDELPHQVRRMPKKHSGGGRTVENAYWKIVRENPGLTAMEIVNIARARGDKKLLAMTDEAAEKWMIGRLRKDTKKTSGDGNRMEVDRRFWFKDQWREYQNPRLAVVSPQ